VRLYPAIDIEGGASDELLAALDDFEASALEERDGSTRVFFSTPAARDRARDALSARFTVSALEVSDEDWGRRSQENLPPVTVGRITLVSSPDRLDNQITDHFTGRQSPIALVPIALVIPASMAFGTGHHASTRLCLAALQALDPAGATVLDLGTGSGVLAMAAVRLGASRAVGIDIDPDAIESARENLALNPGMTAVSFEVGDFMTQPMPCVDLITANLTGVLLVRGAPRILDAVRDGGTLVLSGILTHERDAVVGAYAGVTVTWEREEDGWVGLAMKIQ
jgi:ribosomal protein L11 methyltransferase